MQARTDCLAEKFAKNLDRLRTARVDALTQAMDTQLMLRTLLQHEVRRMEKKLGAEHPRTQGLRARLQANRGQINALAVERERFQVKVPDVAEDGALIHGRVVDEEGRGIAGLMVCLVERSGVPIANMDEPITDTSGYFAITLDPEAIDRLRKVHEAGVFLAVFTVKRRLVHQQPKPLALVPGARLLEEIPLNRNELLRGGSVKPPPPECRTVIVPELIGRPEDAAIKLLKEADLKPGARKTRPALNQVGLVLEQEPAAGTRVMAGFAVSLVIGIAEEWKVGVPMLIGLTLKEAKARIEESGLVLGSVGGPSPSDTSVVRQQNPEPDSEVSAGTAMDLVVAR